MGKSGQPKPRPMTDITAFQASCVSGVTPEALAAGT